VGRQLPLGLSALRQIAEERAAKRKSEAAKTKIAASVVVVAIKATAAMDGKRSRPL
jgi:hypothetical protein